MQTNFLSNVQDSPQDFWEANYAATKTSSGGTPSAVLRNFASTRSPRLALDLGCGRGDDAVWLALQGWRVVGVDISSTAIDAARASSHAAGVADRTYFLPCDLSDEFPDRIYDLVSVVYLQSPAKSDRLNVLRRASESVARGGLFLVASHRSWLPRSRVDETVVLPSAEEEFAELKLSPDDWRRLFVGELSCQAEESKGQIAMVNDNIIAIERL